MFIITIFKDSSKVEINRNNVSKGVKKSLCIKRLFSWYSKICWFLAKKYWFQQNWKVTVTWLTYFLDHLWVRYNCVKFHHCRICVTDFQDGGSFCPLFPHPWAAPKKPILNRVKGYFTLLPDATKMYLGFNRPSSLLWLSSFIIWKPCNTYILL